MKRTYIICFLFLVSLATFLLAYIYFSKNAKLDYENPSKEEETLSIELMTQAGLDEVKINNLTTIKLQTYDVDSNVLTEEKINTPVEFLEMTRNDLIAYLKNYMSSPNTEDRERGILSFELIEFSRGEVVIRKSYQTAILEENDELRVLEENGYIVIYYAKDRTLYDYTNIRVKGLPEEIQEKIKSGIEFKNEDDLYEFLEAYTS